MTERQARDAMIARSERDIDQLFRPLTRAVREAVRRHETMTPLAYVLIMREVDQALTSIRGRFPGDRTAPLYRLVVQRCREARAIVFGQSADDMRRRLRGNPDVMAAIEREAA